MYKIKSLILYFIILSLLITSCGKQNKKESKSETKKRIKVGLAMGYGGVGDQSFNDMQYNGLIEASRNFNIDIAYRVPDKDTEEAVEYILEDLITNEKCDFIISAGYLAANPVYKISQKYPNKYFANLDSVVKSNHNVLSVMFAQHEGSFVVGYLMAKFSKSKKIGFIGGVNIDVIDAFYKGFEEGVKYSKEKVTIYKEYVSLLPNFSGFSDPEKGYNIAKSMYNKGVDVIYSVAGGTGNGIIKAARDFNKYVVGVDADQDYLAKGNVITSMMKRLDNAVIDLIYRFINNKLEFGKTIEYNYKNKGVSLTEMKYTKDLFSEELLNDIKQIEEKIINGEIKVTNILKY